MTASQSPAEPPAPGPLAGVRVIEFGNLIAAPYATMLLADLGADVIKVEPPGGDLGRHFGPYIEDESAFFLSVNRGKRSIALDLGDERDGELASALCRVADVVVHNLRRGALGRRGLGYEDVSRTNPGVIYAEVSAFGIDGPAADRVGIDVIFQAESGMMSITGEPGSGPGKTATTIGDYVAGTNAALAICAALVDRVRSGRGRRVEVSLRDGLLAVQGGWNAIAFAADEQPPKMGTASPFLAPNQCFETADGHLAVAIVSNRHFERLCQALDRPDWIARWPGNDARMEDRATLAELLETVFVTATTEHWVALLTDAGIPVGRVMTLPEVWSDPQVAHNRMVQAIHHPVAGPTRVIGSPLRYDGNPAFATRPPPLLDQHSAAIRSEMDPPGRA